MKRLQLRQTLEEPVNGFWDGGPKQVFYWAIDMNFSDGKTRIGSWGANHFFEVKTGKTEKLTLSYAKQHLQRTTRAKIKSFEYIEE